MRELFGIGYRIIRMVSSQWVLSKNTDPLQTGNNGEPCDCPSILPSGPEEGAEPEPGRLWVEEKEGSWSHRTENREEAATQRDPSFGDWANDWLAHACKRRAIWDARGNNAGGAQGLEILCQTGNPTHWHLEGTQEHSLPSRKRISPLWALPWPHLTNHTPNNQSASKEATVFQNIAPGMHNIQLPAGQDSQCQAPRQKSAGMQGGRNTGPTMWRMISQKWHNIRTAREKTCRYQNCILCVWKVK